MQGTSGRGYPPQADASPLIIRLRRTDGILRFARRVKSNEINMIFIHFT